MLGSRSILPGHSRGSYGTGERVANNGEPFISLKEDNAVKSAPPAALLSPLDGISEKKLRQARFEEEQMQVAVCFGLGLPASDKFPFLPANAVTRFVNRRCGQKRISYLDQ